MYVADWGVDTDDDHLLRELSELRGDHQRAHAVQGRTPTAEAVVML